MDFVTSFPRAVLDRIVSQYFKNLGILSPSTELEIQSILFDPDQPDFEITADLKEQTVQ